MKKLFRSNGKLLLTSEYFVLDGAKALALPTKKGQSLVVYPNDTKFLEWKSFDEQNKIWFEGKFGSDFKIVISSDEKMANTLIKMLKKCKEINPHFNPFGNKIETFLEFPINWGLGSSSTLINNLAQWAQINPFKLLWKSFTGSGYDIANAFHDNPIVYYLKDKKPVVEEIDFSPDFRDQLYFVHLNQKQNSREGINHYRSLNINKKEIIQKLNDSTKRILKSKTLNVFEKELNKHENIISESLAMERVQNHLFSEYSGVVKSLGAWGGDFVLVTFRKEMYSYFNSKGYKVIIPFVDMIK